LNVSKVAIGVFLPLDIVSAVLYTITISTAIAITMTYQTYRPEPILTILTGSRLGTVQPEHRNFSICPHCIKQGKEGVLWRLSEGFPMISRSDGETYHLLLADRQRAYPAELSFRTSALSLCFMYEHLATGNTTHVALVVIFEQIDCPRLTYRQIEDVADLLAWTLMENSELPSLLEGERTHESENA
jgi:hypothetical protein